MSAPAAAAANASEIKPNAEQQRAVDLQIAGQHCFLTGKAGTGKSACIPFARKGIHKRGRIIYYAAPTGVAAAAIEGTTLHSYFGIGIQRLSGRELAFRMSFKSKERVRETDALHIDEISMVSAEDFERYDELCKVVRKNYDEPFGGMQLIVSGDFAQLPPVFPPGASDKRLAFESPVWKKMFGPHNSIELTQIFRQDEKEFLSLLDDLRSGSCSQSSLATIRQHEAPLLPKNGIEPTRLYAKKREVESYNDARLAALPGEEVLFKARDSIISKDMTPEKLEKNMRVPRELRLRAGAQVMLLENKDVERGLCNGSRAVVTAVHDTWVDLLFLNGVKLECIPSTFEVQGADGEVEATRKQLPLALAWAVTIHKSQGLSLDYVIVDLEGCFENGQAYVAVSRGRRLDGVQFQSFTPSCVKTDKRVTEFMQVLRAGMKATAAPPAASGRAPFQSPPPKATGKRGTSTYPSAPNNRKEKKARRKYSSSDSDSDSDSDSSDSSDSD